MKAARGEGRGERGEGRGEMIGGFADEKQMTCRIR